MEEVAKLNSVEELTARSLNTRFLPFKNKTPLASKNLNPFDLNVFSEAT